MQSTQDLSGYNLAQLRELSGQVEKAIVKAERRELDAAGERIYAIALEMNMPLKTLLERTGILKTMHGGKLVIASDQHSAPRKSREPSGVRYVHPTDNTLVWLGQGPRPKWLKHLLENTDYTLEQLAQPRAA